MTDKDKKNLLFQEENPREGSVTHTELDRLTLYEERAKVEILREQTGAVTVRKVIRERTETIPVTLKSEVLEIVLREGGGQVLLNGEALEAGRTYEVLVTEERATVEKQVFAHSNVNLTKHVHTHTHTEDVVLRREELDVQGPQELIQDVVVDPKS